MLTTVRYEYQTGVFAWPIPFPFAHAGQVKCRSVNAEGMETQLIEGKDYAIEGSNVIRILPQGEALVIYLDAPAAEAAAGNNQRVLSQLQQSNMASVANVATAMEAPVTQPMQVQTAQAQTTTNIDADRLAALEQMVSGLLVQNEKLLEQARLAERDAQIQSLRETSANCKHELQATAQEANQSISNAAELAKQEMLVAELELSNNTQSLLQATAEADQATARLTQAAQKAQTAQAQATLAMQAADEAGLEIEAFNTEAEDAFTALRDKVIEVEARLDQHTRDASKTLAAFNKEGAEQARQSSVSAGQAKSFATDAANSASQANGHAVSASNAARAADIKLAQIQTNGLQAIADIKREGSEGQEAIRKTRVTTLAEIAQRLDIAITKIDAALAENIRCEKRSTNSASQANELAICAWQAAWQASLDNVRPGIASVRMAGELSNRPSGVYFVNAKLAAPAQFMGVWPVASLADANWDGVFFIGKPYPDMPKLPDPPAYPSEPSEVPEMRPEAMVKHWLPCEHKHG